MNCLRGYNISVHCFRGVEKGVMVPPVVVDYNNDSVKDILMTSFEGINNLYSGKDLSLIWTANFSGMETYGYFNFFLIF
jgi:hypothetical protein